MSLKENIMRQLSIFLYEKLYSTAQEIMGQVEQALTLALNQVELQEINTQHLDFVTNIPAALKSNRTEVSLPLMAPTHLSALESHYSPNVEVSPKCRADQCIYDQDYFLDRTKTEKEEGPISEIINFISLDDVGKGSNGPITQLSDGLPSDFANDSDDSTEEWWVRHGAKPTVKNQQRNVSEQPSDSKDEERRQTREGKYSCEICGRSFSLKGNLESHKRTHTGERPYKCDVCGKSFTQRGSLKTHKHTHTGERPYKCDLCTKSFIQRSALKTHKRTHTGERPYKCDICTKSFIQRSALKTHKPTHTGERPYKCDLCTKSFIQRSALKTHKPTHTGERPYKCDLCTKSFIQRSALKTHKRTHTGERPYKCDLCTKSFIQRSDLKVHKRTHTGERPYSCNVCGESFMQKVSLRRHELAHRALQSNTDECEHSDLTEATQTH